MPAPHQYRPDGDLASEFADLSDRRPVIDYPPSMWACVPCGAVRQWGNGEPEDGLLRPWLRCESHAVGRCLPPGTVTEHKFVRVRE